MAPLTAVRRLRIGSERIQASFAPRISSPDSIRFNAMTQHLWRFLPIGYLITIAIETPVLLVGLSRPHPWQRRLFAGVWLTACTYPIVVLVLPVLIPPDPVRWPYLLVAETFAPVAECTLFAAAFHRKLPLRDRVQDLVAITLANLLSFGLGEWLGRLL